jgi:alpha-tubulin suppressor-like RCC1 family protein
MKIPFFSNHSVSQIACGETHNVVLTKSGKVFGWGSSNFG